MASVHLVFAWPVPLLRFHTAAPLIHRTLIRAAAGGMSVEGAGMALREEHHHHSPRDVPPVGRPRGAVWRSLQADGVVWEGQVLLVGGDVDLAARMVVTHRRVVFVRGGDVVLDISRAWMRQEPRLRRDGILELFVATPGGSIFDEPTPVPIRMREGHPAAGHIIAMLAPGGARRIAPDALSGMERAREASQGSAFGGFWDAFETETETDRSEERASVEHGPRTPENVATPGESAGLIESERRDRVIRVSSTPARQSAAAGFPIAGIAPRDQRRSSWGLILRIGALVILLATAAALGAGRLHVSLPGRPASAVLAVPTPTTAAPAGEESPASALTGDELTAVAVGVGGGQDDPSPPLVAAAQTETDTPGAGLAASPPVETTIPETAAIPTPAEGASSSPPAVAAADPAAAVQAAPETAPADPATAPANPLAAEDTATQAAVPSPQPDEPDVALSAQQMVVGDLRLSFPMALRGESLPRYGLPPGAGEWVLIESEVRNEGPAAASLALADARLFDRTGEQSYALDGGADVIASLAGFEPAYGANDVVTLDPGGSARMLLLFLLPAGSSENLALTIGEASIDVAPLLAADAAEAKAPTVRFATSRMVRIGDLTGGRLD